MMSRILNTALRLFIATTVLVSAANSLAAETDSKLEAVRAQVTAEYPFIEPRDVGPSPIKGWYTIHKGSIVAYISEDGHYLLQGDLIDLTTDVNLSEQTRATTRRNLLATVKDDDAILFSPADVKYTVTVFTDVDCSYCRKLHSQINGYMDLGIAVRYLLYPRNGPASRAWTTSEDVMCASDRGSALTAAKLDREFKTTKCETTALTQHYSLGRDIGLSGTPAIILEDGSLIGGYLSPEALAMRLQQSGAN